MKTFRLLAFVAVVGVAACDTPPEAAAGGADPAVMEGAADETDADVAIAAPAPGDYDLVAVDGGTFEEGDAGLLRLEASTWTSYRNGERTGNGTWRSEGGRLHFIGETGDCAGHEAAFALDMSDTGFTMDLVETTCERAPTRLEYARAGGDT
jgi:hypothetical protein